jgi:hypothetical protein
MTRVVGLRQEVALGMAAERYYRLLQLWLNVRSASPKGSGRILWQSLRTFDYLSWTSIRRYIDQGIDKNIFWAECLNGNRYLFHASEARLYLMVVGFERPFGRYVRCDLDELNGMSLAQIGAFLFDAGVNGPSETGYSNPVARGRNNDSHGLRGKSGKSRRTQRRYEEERGISVRPNIAIIEDYSPAQLSWRRAAAMHNGDPLPFRHETSIVVQIANAYRGTVEGYPSSTAHFWRRVRKLARTMDANLIGSLFSKRKDISGNSPEHRAYYGSVSGASRASSKVPSSGPRYGWVGHSRPGRGLWREV